MNKVVAEEPGAYYQYYPRTVAIVTAYCEGRKNALAVAWHCPVSYKPPLYGISVAPKRFTYHMIIASGQFGLNFLACNCAELIAAVGGSSGSFTDKFSEFDISVDLPVKTDVPVLKNAYAAYECRVVEDHVYGDHTWIIGEIVAVHMAENVFKENGIIDIKLVKPALYLGAETYCGPDADSATVLEREKYGKR